MLDLLIRGGTVVDGTGSASYAADVAVENGRIVEVGALPGAHARRIISADGKLVTPGFIDIHRHADLAAWRPGFGQPELRQGLTTIVNGNCGLSAAPMRRAKRAEIAAYLQPICGEMKNKREMMRVLKTPEGPIVLDATGRKNGRGAYLCKSLDCLKKARKNRGLERSFQMSIPDEVYDSLEKEFGESETE